MLISRSFQKRPISKIDRFMVTLFDLGLPLTAPRGNSTAGLIVTGRCMAFQWYNIWVCMGDHLNWYVRWFCSSPKMTGSTAVIWFLDTPMTHLGTNRCYLDNSGIHQWRLKANWWFNYSISRVALQHIHMFTNSNALLILNYRNFRQSGFVFHESLNYAYNDIYIHWTIRKTISVCVWPVDNQGYQSRVAWEDPRWTTLGEEKHVQLRW